LVETNMKYINIYLKTYWDIKLFSVYVYIDQKLRNILRNSRHHIYK